MTDELQRALSDLAEVRDRLAQVQRFEGYSGPAAVLSGVAAFVAGYAQLRLAPIPQTPDALRTYLQIWMICLAVAIALNYGAVIAWMIRHGGPIARSQFRTAARSIAPSIVLGGALTLALVEHSAYTLLPGTWFAFSATGLFASRAVIPGATIAITAAFGVLALLFLVTSAESLSLAWWVMPLGFGVGQSAIGVLVWKERNA